MKKNITSNQLLKNKSHYQSLNYSGFKWYAFSNGLHHFSRPHPESNEFTTIQCTEEMLTNGDIEYMVENGLTYAPKH